MAMLAVQQDDGFPLVGLETPVDTLRFRLHFCLQIVIALDVCTAWRSDLHEREDALITRILLEETFDREKALENTLGVIEAINADTHQSRFYSQRFQKSAALLVSGLGRM